MRSGCGIVRARRGNRTPSRAPQKLMAQHMVGGQPMFVEILSLQESGEMAKTKHQKKQIVNSGGPEDVISETESVWERCY